LESGRERTLHPICDEGVQRPIERIDVVIIVPMLGIEDAR